MGGNLRNGGRIELKREGIRVGLLIEVQRRSARIVDEFGKEYDCFYSPEIDLREFSSFAVGDRIEFFPGDLSQQPLITAILPRTSKITRPGPSERWSRELVLAANVDLLVVVISPKQPDFQPRFLDRYLLIAEHSGVPALICMNKSDLGSESPKEVLYLKEIGYDSLTCSALTGEGMPALRDALRGRMAVLSGSSGVGKSSMICSLFPGAQVRTTEVRSHDGKGRHTTTTSHMHISADGLKVIDTPGLRELGMWAMKPMEVAREWREFIPYFGQCRFTDCMHRSEPDCAVLAAVASGKIPEFRLQSYHRILDTLNTPDEFK